MCQCRPLQAWSRDSTVGVREPLTKESRNKRKKTPQPHHSPAHYAHVGQIQPTPAPWPSLGLPRNVRPTPTRAVCPRADIQPQQRGGSTDPPGRSNRAIQVGSASVARCLGANSAPRGATAPGSNQPQSRPSPGWHGGRGVLVD